MQPPILPYLCRTPGVRRSLGFLGFVLRELGMESFADTLSEEDAELVRQYIISRANLDRAAAADEAEEL